MVWSAIVGALIAVGSMFGITTEQVAEQKAKTEEVRKLAGEALELAKSGKLDDAKAKLEKAIPSTPIIFIFLFFENIFIN